MSLSMEYFNLEMDRVFGSVGFRPLLPPYRCQAFIPQCTAKHQMKAMDIIFLLVPCDLKMTKWFKS